MLRFKAGTNRVARSPISASICVAFVDPSVGAPHATFGDGGLTRYTTSSDFQA